MASGSSLLIRRDTDTIDIRLEYRGQSQVIGLIGSLVIISTAVAFAFAIFWVDYTCNHVIGTLAAVEDSHPENYVRLEGEISNDSCDPTDVDFMVLEDTQPITSGLHSGIKHLRARGGIWSCFRGFPARNFVGLTVTSLFATRGFKELLNALICILPGIFFLLVSLPARAIYIRVAASMLPEEDDPIVPFDRLFGGKTNLNMAGGGDKLGLKDAWVTFERSARSRYFRTILKALAIEVALGVVGTILVMGEVFLVTSIR
ncbi:hypothetical protein PoHVEF18_004353 [Penicillium ochrochloron]